MAKEEVEWDGERQRRKITVPKKYEQNLLTKEDEGPSPLAMGLLQLGASMMRDEGWQDRPITLGESIGKAIPYGIAGYYNQQERNRVNRDQLLSERQGILKQQQAEETALSDQEEKKRKLGAFIQYVDGLDDTLLNPTGKGGKERTDRRRRAIVERFLISPKDAYEHIDSLRDKEADRNKPTTGDTEAAIHLRNAMPQMLEGIKNNTLLEKKDIDLFLNKYDFIDPRTMTHLELKEMRKEYQSLLATTRGKEDLVSRNEGMITTLEGNLPQHEQQNLAEIQQVYKDNPQKLGEELDKLFTRVQLARVPTNQPMTKRGDELIRIGPKDRKGKPLFTGLDPTKFYNFIKNADGTFKIISSADYGVGQEDYTPDKAISYIDLLGDLEIIGPQQIAGYKKVALTDPKTVMSDLQKVMAKSLEDTVEADPNEGKVMSGKEIMDESKGKIKGKIS